MSNVSLPKFRTKKYHRRSFWACDECKLRKKKCDGSQPCATCALHGKGVFMNLIIPKCMLTECASTDCTYDSKTRPSKPPTHRIRELEDDVRSVRALLTRLRENLTDDALTEVDLMLVKLKPALADEPEQLSSPTATEKSSADYIQTISCGQDRLLRNGASFVFHSSSSGPGTILSVLEFFQPLKGETIVPEVLNLFDAKFSASSELSSDFPHYPSELPEKSKCFELLNVVLMQSHPFLQFLDTQSLYRLFEDCGSTTPPSPRQDYDASLSLCHMLIAVGSLFSVSHHRKHGCEWVHTQAKKHFTIGCRLLELSDCDNLICLQAYLCAAVFLISLSHLSNAYSYISLAAISATKQGLLVLERATPSSLHNYGANDHQIIIAMINLDLYVSTILGLPQSARPGVAEKKLDEMMDENITESNPISDDHSIGSESFQTTEKFFRMVSLTASVLQSYNDTVSHDNSNSNQGAGVDEAILRNAVKELARMSKNLAPSASPNAESMDVFSTRSMIARTEVELTLCWSQISLHLPFIHYLRPLADGQPVPEAASRPALTCLKIAVNFINRCDSLLQSLTTIDMYSQIMHPSNWTCIYTLFLAIVALIFLISIHDGTSKPSEAWLKANTGIRILSALRCKDGGAVRCLAMIKQLVHQLNYTVDFDFESIERTSRPVCESHTRLPTLSNILDGPSTQQEWMMQDHNDTKYSGNTAAEPGSSSMSSADKMLAQAQRLPSKEEPGPSEA